MFLYVLCDTKDFQNVDFSIQLYDSLIILDSVYDEFEDLGFAWLSTDIVLASIYRDISAVSDNNVSLFCVRDTNVKYST